MKREYLAVWKGNKIKIYGTKCAFLFGDLRWGHVGTIFYDEKFGEYMFELNWLMSYMTEKLVRVVDCEIEKLRKTRGKV